MLVVITHASSMVAQPRFFGAQPFGGRLLHFGVGVDFFFVLSGFIIAWVHWDDIGRITRFRRYALSRFVRIFPIYWAILFPLIILYQIFPNSGIASQHDPLNILASIVLAPYPAPPVMGVAWTLVYEIIFYIVFGLCIILGKKPAIAIILGWGCLVVLAQFQFSLIEFPFSILLNAHILEFLLGVGCAVGIRKHALPAPLAIAGAAAVVFVSAMIFSDRIAESHLLSRAVFGISAALFIAGIVQYERRNPLPVPGWLRLVGAASYSIYLIHGVVQSATIQVIFRTAPNLDLTAATALLVVSGVLGGVICHIMVERPLNTWLREFILPKPKSIAIVAQMNE